MFRSARLKLTSWYLLIIMIITLSFSTFVYLGVGTNTRRALEGQRRRFERQMTRPGGGQNFLPMGPMIDMETLSEIREQTLMNLIVMNVAIFLISGSLSYLLAGKTLKPIEEMVDKQKRFISDAAHEIKTPLTSMKTSLEVTLRDKKLEIDEAKEVLESTIEEVDKLSKFTAKLLKQSKYQNGGGTAYHEVKLDFLITGICKKMSPLAKKKNTEVNLNLDTVTVKGSKEELEEVFTNLIDNAIKYNKKDSVINIELKGLGGMAIATIEDFGNGISEKDISNIFEPFYRGDLSRTDSEHEGYGLGLAISKEIVERHKGKITVESVLGSGSKFTVRIPISS